MLIFSTIILLNAFYFSVVLEETVYQWLTTNLCVSASLIVILGFLTKNKGISNIAVPLLLVFGIGGFFLMGWNNLLRLYSQAHHFLMVLTAIYILVDSYQVKEFKRMKIGLIIGLITLFVLGDIATNPANF